jgi:hypothetical protein
VREAERAWFLSEGEKSEALIRVAFDSQGQKQRVLEPYSLSLSSMVASSIPKHLFYPGKKMLTEGLSALTLTVSKYILAHYKKRNSYPFYPGG